MVDPAADAQELDEVTSGLREELLDLDAVVSAAEGGESPPGARAVLSFTLGGLVIALAGTELLASIVNGVIAWLNRHQHRSVKLDIDGDVLELTGIPSQEQRRLTEVWLRRRDRPVAPARTGRRLALIVAGDEFQDPGLRRLRAPALDAEALARVLSDEAIGGFDVRTMLNEPTAVVNEAVEDFFADRDPDDLLLLHFSGHGVKDDNGELYLATPSTKLNRLAATGVSAEFVNRQMSRSRCRRIVLLLDCCYAGAFARGALPRAGAAVYVEEQFGGRGRVVITASNALEYAFDGTDLADAQEPGSPSVFTRALVEGLKTGEADRDQDGYVGIHELYDYVYDRVRAITPKQTPGKWTFDVQGELIIARRSRPVDRPAPLPSELQEAVDHPIAKIRAGAIDELERLRHSRHAGLALAARLALERLAHDDSRSVSAAAARALGRSAEGVERTASSPHPAAPPSQATAATSTTPGAASDDRTRGGASDDRTRGGTGDGRSARSTSGQGPASTAVSPERAPGRAAIAGEGRDTADGGTDAALPAVTSVKTGESRSGYPVAGDAAPGTAGRRSWPALASRVPALLAGLLLILSSGGRELNVGELAGILAEHILWLWFLTAAAFGIALLPEGRWRDASLGAGAGLAGLHLGMLAYLDTTGYSSLVKGIFILVAGLVILLIAFVETALAQPDGGWWKVAGGVGSALTLVAIVINQQNPHGVKDDPFEEPSWLAVFTAVVLLTGFFAGRVLRVWRTEPARAPLLLSAAATLLVLVDVCVFYPQASGSDYPHAPLYAPALLVLLLMTAQVIGDRPELTAAVQLAVIAGLVHNLVQVQTWPVFVGVLFAAAACACAAVYVTDAGTGPSGTASVLR
ncbi:hypothetical protein D5H75_15725 [Bailinhaonella thermotolerans]|uniref:Peptidase C14 caspase domain-containing protein n=1 Tax=Bailinhaonella thermotolerans TaxID=1070861 RepID=A0A3A4B1C6_9ACTN|nr:hypothetical protein D5H75_15725 [Bailinhaonella thermotolerans]